MIVAGRPNPPIPDDVLADHPLLDDSIVRELAPSPHALVIRRQMERELKRLLHGTLIEQDLLGLVSAAGGGLSSGDLAELTGESRWQVENRLRTVAGRSFSARGSNFPSDGPEVYLLGHEELQVAALDMLGPARIDEYRQRLHIWADGYRVRRWPADTPEYLLRGYFRMLIDEYDVERMLACATDSARHDRLLDLSGGDTAALSEVAATQDTIITQDLPDLGSMVRLAIHRDHLTKRNSHIPSELPAVWIKLGQPNRAESIAGSITNPATRVEASASVGTAMADLGNLDRAINVLDRAEQLIHSITNAKDQVRASITVAVAMAAVGEPDRTASILRRAEQIAQTMPNDYGQQGEALRSVAEAKAAGRLDRAKQNTTYFDLERIAKVLTSLARDMAAGKQEHTAHWLKEADRIACSMSSPNGRVQAWISIADALAAAGELESAADFLDRAERFARSQTDTRHQAETLGTVAAALATAGDLGRAEQIAHSITSFEHRARVLASIADANAEAGELARAANVLEDAEQIARSATDPDQHVRAWIFLSDAMAAVGDLDLAADFLYRAEQIAISIAHPMHRSNTLVSVVRAVATTGFLSRAEQMVRSIPDPGRQVEALGAIAAAAAVAGEVDLAARVLDDAEQTSHSITTGLWASYKREGPLAEVVETVAGVGELHRANGLLDRVEEIARSITDHPFQAQALGSVAIAVAKAGELVRAKRIARSITNTNERARVLVSMASVVAAAGELDHAERTAGSIARTKPNRRAEAFGAVAAEAAMAGELDRALCLLDRAEEAARTRTPSWLPPGAWGAVAAAAATAGEPDRAEEIVRSIGDPDERTRAWISVAGAMVKAGFLDRAERVAYSIVDPRQQAELLASVADALATAGELDHAERIARSIVDPDHQAQAWISIADALPTTGVLDRADRPTHNSLLLRKTHALAEALRITPDWHIAIQKVAELAAQATSEITAELAAVDRSQLHDGGEGPNY